jgi:hypothetical protein
MKIPPADNPPGEKPSGGQEEPTGLPFFKTWRGVYLFVFSCFILWVLLLLALTASYS